MYKRQILWDWPVPTPGKTSSVSILRGRGCGKGLPRHWKKTCKENGDISGTLQAKKAGGYSLNCTHPVRQRYSVRRLTPLECERLQGFPDGWTDIPGQTEATQEELEFWRDVWLTWDKTQAEDPEKVKPRTDKAILKWLKNPTSDSAQYKALGNSVAVPCPEMCIRDRHWRLWLNADK